MPLFFIEGSIKIGKSTLIRQSLAPFRDRLGGFSSQRLPGSDGSIRGYRITDAQDFEIERDYDPALQNIFLERTDNGTLRHQSVFSEYAPVLLNSTKAHDIILLDEIGGSEMLVPSFRDAVYEILSSGKLCIGVIKSADNAARSAARPGMSSMYDENVRLRDFIQHQPDGKVLKIPAGHRLYDGTSSDTAVLIKHNISELLSDYRTTL